VLVLLYGSEVYSKKEGKIRIQVAEMEFLWLVKGCIIMDNMGNEEIRKE
jgi:hypothetical protein